VTGCRLAEPGEFARRAFENGRLDLTAAEGLADLVDAETEAQRKQALVQSGGALARLYDGWRERLLAARALTEAAIDFSDETDVADDALASAMSQARALLAEIETHLADGHRGEIVRDGFRIVLAGPPNVGKSSLMNVLARRDVAIVSTEAGTTRDVLEVRLDLGGYAVILADTAGIREAKGEVEKEGIRRTMERARAADLILWLVDPADPVWPSPEQFGERPILTVMTKADLGGRGDLRPAGDRTKDEQVFSVSSKTGQGLDDLIRHLTGLVASRLGSAASVPLSQERHRISVEACRDAVRRFVEARAKAPIELRAEDLRIAADALGRIVGRIDVEDVLGQIFGRFCIGK
jgi:tRNA modification GTPase